MPITRPTSLTVLVTAGLLVAPATGEAQVLRGIKKTVRHAARSEANREIDALVRSGVRGVFEDLESVRRAEADGKIAVMTDDEGTLLTDEDGRPLTAPAAAAALVEEKPGTGAWANYDFIPGERVLFAEDYMADNVGDFPRRMTFVNGNWEIVEWEGRRLLRNTGPRGSAVHITLPEPLPERFTIELEVYFPEQMNWTLGVATDKPPRALHAGRSIPGNFFRISPGGTGDASPAILASTTWSPVRCIVRPGVWS